MKTYTETLEQMELEALCREVCDIQNFGIIYRGLCRSGICTIEDLRDCDLNNMAKLHMFGEMRLEFVKEMKSTIEDEEKIRSIIRNDVDLVRLRKDEVLFENVKVLHKAEYSVSVIARWLGLRPDTVRHILY